MGITYDGVAYRQSPLATAPWLVAFVASAEQLLTWAGIPRRSEHNLSGFQRAEDPIRIATAKAYFGLPDNQSPTALVVGIHPPAPGQAPRIRLDFTDHKEGELIRPCRLTVDFDPSVPTLAEAVELVRRQLAARLGATPSNGGDDVEVDSADDVEDEDADLDDGEGGQDGGDVADANLSEEDEGQVVEIELGRSILRRLLERLDDPQWCATQEEALRDLAKPATIIDGQHRVKGAEACERNIPFTICAIFDCPWSEQVFQFTVVNYTAKGIPDQFITANAALSLTKPELDELADRLVQAGVKVIEYELMKVVQFDDRSPFNDLVDLTEKREGSKIGYKTMVQVARAWYDGKHPVFSLILPNLYPDLKGKRAKTARINRWKESGDWGNFFIDFWRVVQTEYASSSSHEAGHHLWDVGHSQLMNAVVLLELQRAYLKNLNDQDEEFFELNNSDDPVRDMRAKLVKRSEKFVDWLPGSFFATKWGFTSLNTGPGRKILQQALRQFVDSKGQFQYAKSAIITGQADK